MANNYVGEIRPVGFNFAPVGWALCNGQLLSISEYDTLFTLIGTTYGGDGQSTFGLPNLQSRVPIHTGSPQGGPNYPLGATGGVENVTITTNQLPVHNHTIAVQAAVASGGQNSPAGHFFSSSTIEQFGAPQAGAFSAPILLSQGGSQPHENLQPYLCVNYIIALFGIFPSAS